MAARRNSAPARSGARGDRRRDPPGELASTLRSPDDLRNATLIVVSDMPNEWPRWFEAAGLRSPLHPAGEALFESNAMAMQAALDGVGVAIAQFPYVSDALAAGRLVAPFPIIAHTPEAWFLEHRPAYREDPALLAFRDWLHQEADRERQVESVLVNRGSMGAMGARTKVVKR